LVARQPPGKSQEGKIDTVVGGHFEATDECARCGFDREFKEELTFQLNDARPMPRDWHRIRQFGSDAEWSWEAEFNREASTVFAVICPRNAELHVTCVDDNADGTDDVCMDADWCDVNELIDRYRANREEYADGLGRVLDKLAADRLWRSRFKSEVLDLADQLSVPRR